ncbi:MAG: hypothetical protein ACJ74O_13820 [Frankiaceae bacterium]
MSWPRLVLVVIGLTLARVTADAAGAHAGIVNRAYLFALGAALLNFLIGVVDRHATTPAATAFDNAATPTRVVTERPARLLSLQDLAAVGSGNAQGAHFHLRPHLRSALRDALATRGVDLDTDPRAPEMLGAVTWELVRPDRPPPADGRAAGLDDKALSAVTATLERIR